MADSSRTIMTDAGFALEARICAGQTKIEFTRASISTADHFKDTDDVLAKLKVLDDVQQDGQVTDVQVIDDTTVYVQVDVDQTKAPADYEMRSAALYAKDDDGTEVLYGVTVLQDPVFVHKDADGSYLGFGINTTVGRASNVVVVVDPANMVTQQVFESTMKNYYTKAEVDAKFVTDDDFASKLPKNIATTDAANTFAKSQTLAGGATDGAGNAIATTKDVSDGDAETLKSAKNYADTKISGKADDSTVVHTADMRKPANDVAGIEEVNAKQDKLTITPADDSKVVHTADTSNWQKQKITNDDGGNKYSFTTANTTDLAAAIQALPLGYHTFYCQSGVKGNPSSQSVRGIAEITTAGANPLGVGYLTDSTGDFWSFYVDSFGLRLKNKQDKLDYTPANAANVVDRNPDTGVVSEPTDFTNLTVNGGKSVATSDDLKSLEDASWHTITGKSDSLSAYTCMYRKNNEQKYVDLVLYGTMGITVNTSSSYTKLLDLSEIISTPKNAKGMIVCPISAASGGGVSGGMSISGTKLSFSWMANDTYLYSGEPIISVGNDINSPFLRVTFD